MRLSKYQAKELLPRVLACLTLYKSDAGTQRAFRLLAKVRERHDGNFADIFSGWLDDVKSELGSIDVSERADFIKAINDAFDTDSLLSSYKVAVRAFLDDYSETFDREVGIQTDWDKVGTTAVDKLGSSVGRLFSMFSDVQQSRIQGILEVGMANGDATPLISRALAEGMDSVVYSDEDGTVTRTLDPEVWASQVARTETNRAYSEATKDALIAASLNTWQWIAEGSCCDECDLNSDEIVNIGDSFPSGDEQPPAHPNCRCVVTAVEAELTDEGD